MESLTWLKLLPYKWWVYVAVGVGLFTSVADHGSVAVALPTISKHFEIDLPTAQWVALGYAITISALLLPMGRMSDLIGRKQIYVTGLVVFVGGTIASGLATGIDMLLAARVIAGMGAAMTQATSMAIVVSAFSDSERGKALGLQISVVGLGGVAGPILGGVVVDFAGWRWLFFITALLGVISIALGQKLLKRHGHKSVEDKNYSPSFDWVGAFLSSVILVILLATMTLSATLGWVPFIYSLILLEVVLFVLLMWWELRSKNPIFDPRLFKDNVVSLGIVSRFSAFIGISSVRFLIPFYLQYVLGYTPRAIGLITVPSALVMVLMGPVGGRLSDRYGHRVFTTGGLLISSVGLLAISRVTDTSPLPLIVGAMIVQSVGSGIFGAPNSSSLLGAVSSDKYGVMAGFIQLVRNLGNVTGVALVTATVTTVMAVNGHEPALSTIAGEGGESVLSSFVSGLRGAYLLTGGIVGCGALLSAFQPNALNVKSHT